METNFSQIFYELLKHGWCEKRDACGKISSHWEIVQKILAPDIKVREWWEKGYHLKWIPIFDPSCHLIWPPKYWRLACIWLHFVSSDLCSLNEVQRMARHLHVWLRDQTRSHNRPPITGELVKMTAEKEMTEPWVWPVTECNPWNPSPLIESQYIIQKGL